MMKKAILVLSAVMLAFCFRAAAQDKQTEEYAIVEYREIGKFKKVTVTVGEAPAIALEWNMIDKDSPKGFTPVMKELSALNKKGFTILNVSSTYTVPGNSSSVNGLSGNGEPRFIWMMVRKIE